MSIHRTGALVATFASVLLVTTACANPAPAVVPTEPPTSSESAAPSASGPGHASVTARFGSDPTAYNYDKKLVPDGAKVLVVENVLDGSTTVTLIVRGLLPNHAYGAHAHAKPCGATGEDAGPHYQNMPDPVKPSVDPEFANKSNEIWLDFKTDAKGNASSVSTVPWTFSDAGSSQDHMNATGSPSATEAPVETGTPSAAAAPSSPAAPAGSVVIHAQPTQTAPGKAGTAGARAACVSVDF